MHNLLRAAAEALAGLAERAHRWADWVEGAAPAPVVGGFDGVDLVGIDFSTSVRQVAVPVILGWERYRRQAEAMRQPGLDATNWRAELAIRFGVILRKVWGGSRTWAGARAQSVLMSVWRTCWQQGRSALDFLSHLLRGTPVALAWPP